MATAPTRPHFRGGTLIAYPPHNNEDIHDSEEQQLPE
jgi:hypothetical protein